MNTDYQLIAQLVGKYPLLDFLAVFFAKYLPYVVVLVFVLVLLLMQSKYERLKILLFWFFSMILTSGIIGPVIHYFFFRPRPFVVYDTIPLITMDAAMASFPSSHTIFFFTLASVVFLGISRKWGSWLFGVAVLIGLARVYVGVHFLLDILGGAVIGFLVPLIVWLIFDKFWKRDALVDVSDTEPVD